MVVEIIGAFGLACWSKSADPERDVDELLPCLATRSKAEAMMEAVVETL